MMRLAGLTSRPSRLGLMGLLVAGLAVGAVRHALADAGDVRLGIAPVDYSGQYFDVTMAPGETRDLKVEVANHGDTSISALTYAADAYTIPGGGFGAGLDGDPISGATRWLSYAPVTLDLPPGNGITRSFSVTVPADAQPGEYITSLVVQNADPIGSTGSGVTMNQVHRTAIAVVVSVPGPRRPALSIGAIEHSFLDSKSVVSATITNSGNVRLKPAGQLVLADDQGRELSRVIVAMDSVYAGNTTVLEAAFDRALTPGDYRVSLELHHEGGTARTTGLPVVVPVPTRAEAEGAPSAAGPPLSAQPGDSTTSRFASWRLPVLAVSLLALTAVLISRAYSRRRRDRTPARASLSVVPTADARTATPSRSTESSVIPLRRPLARAAGDSEHAPTPRSPLTQFRPQRWSTGGVEPDGSRRPVPLESGESVPGDAPNRAVEDPDLGDCWNL